MWIRPWQKLFEEAPSGEGEGGVSGLPPAADADDAVQRMMGELKTLGEGVSRLASKVDSIPVQPPAPSNNPTKDDLTKQHWKDPLTSTAQLSQAIAQNEIAKTMGPYHETMVSVAKQQAKGSGLNAEIFEALEGAIVAKVNLMPANAHGMVSVWTNAFNLAKGENIDKVMEITNKHRKVNVPRPGDDGPNPPSHAAPPAPPKLKLSADESAVAKGMGLSDEEYLKGKEYAGNPDSLFNEHLTIKGRRRARPAA